MLYGNFPYPQTTYYFFVCETRKLYPKKRCGHPVCYTLKANTSTALVKKNKSSKDLYNYSVPTNNMSICVKLNLMYAQNSIALFGTCFIKDNKKIKPRIKDTLPI